LRSFNIWAIAEDQPDPGGTIKAIFRRPQVDRIARKRGGSRGMRPEPEGGFDAISVGRRETDRNTAREAAFYCWTQGQAEAGPCVEGDGYFVRD
jgi:hypothetical protein